MKKNEVFISWSSFNTFHVTSCSSEFQYAKSDESMQIGTNTMATTTTTHQMLVELLTQHYQQ